MKLLAFLVAAFCLFANSPTAHAQRPEHGKHRHKQARNLEMRKEMRQYAKENILPTLRQQRLKLDAELSAQEKTEINTLREQLKADKKVMHLKHQTFRQAKKDGTADIEALKTEMKGLREKHRATIEKLKVIAKKHDAKIAQLREEIKPQIEKWTTDMDKIIEKNGETAHAQHIKKKASRLWDKGAVGFLLMPTEEPQPKKTKTDTQDITQIYPNPAQESQQLKLTLKEAGEVKIVLLDKQGNYIQTVFEGAKTAGEYVFDVNTSRLTTGNYTYQINTPSGRSTKKLVIKK